MWNWSEKRWIASSKTGHLSLLITHPYRTGRHNRIRGRHNPFQSRRRIGSLNRARCRHSLALRVLRYSDQDQESRSLLPNIYRRSSRNSAAPL